MSISSEETFYTLSKTPFFLGTFVGGFYGKEKTIHAAGAQIAISLYTGYGSGNLIKKTANLSLELLQMSAGAAGVICLSEGISKKNSSLFALGTGIILASSAMVSLVNYAAKQCGIRPH